MTMVERTEGVAQESSNGWNNAGTGHSALMELNYTRKMPTAASVLKKAVAINEAFQISRQFTHQSSAGAAYSAFIYQYRSAYELCLGRG